MIEFYNIVREEESFMPLPLIIGGIAVVAGSAGLGSGIHGGIKMKKASNTIKEAKTIQEEALARFDNRSKKTVELMDSIGTQELEILSSFKDFSDTIEKIQNRPQFKNINSAGAIIPEYELMELKNASVGAGILLGGIGGAAAGTAGGFAAAGATTAAVMAVGTASTGTAISSLSGVAATNATLAALGGGSIAAGGGGMALGSLVLGGATLGVGLLIGGVIFNISGSSLSKKSQIAYEQAKRTDRDVNRIYNYLYVLSKESKKFKNALDKTYSLYKEKLKVLDFCVNYYEKTDWNDFIQKEKKDIENCVLLVGLLFKMCQTKLVYQDGAEDGFNTINTDGISDTVSNSEAVLKDI